VPAGILTVMRSRQYEFLEHYPFAELHLLGWRLKELAPPKRRPGAEDFIRRAMFVDHHGRVLVFDVDRHGQMRDFATYTADDESSWIAETAGAALQLAASDPGAGAGELARIDQVTQIRF